LQGGNCPALLRLSTDWPWFDYRLSDALEAAGGEGLGEGNLIFSATLLMPISHFASCKKVATAHRLARA